MESILCQYNLGSFFTAAIFHDFSMCLFVADSPIQGCANWGGGVWHNLYAAAIKLIMFVTVCHIFAEFLLPQRRLFGHISTLINNSFFVKY